MRSDSILSKKIKMYQVNFLAAFLLAPGVSTLQAASFRCSKASSFIELDTLAGLELLNLDEKLSDSHTRALTVPPTFRHNL